MKRSTFLKSLLGIALAPKLLSEIKVNPTDKELEQAGLDSIDDSMIRVEPTDYFVVETENNWETPTCKDKITIKKILVVKKDMIDSILHS